jgi:hypothetical protein
LEKNKMRLAQQIPTPKTYTAAINTVAQTQVYIGQLVKRDDATAANYNGIAPVTAAVGNGDATNQQMFFGLVAGTNNHPDTETFDQYGQYLAGASTQASQKAVMKDALPGMFAAGDVQPLVRLFRLRSDTVLEANLYAGSFNHPPTVLTATQASLTGTALTSNPCDFTPVAYQSVTYCRSGANANIFRVNADTSTTVGSFTTAFPNPIAIGDTFIRVPLIEGPCKVNFGTDIPGMYINIAQSVATNYFMIDVLEFDLKYSGQEVVRFVMSNPTRYPVQNIKLTDSAVVTEEEINVTPTKKK